jgi:hypothetical protein
MVFLRRSQRAESGDELADLRRSVQNRGQAKIPEAARYVADYVAEVASTAQVSSPDGHEWIRDRLRLFMVMSWDEWFTVVDRLQEGPQLRAEWRSLIERPDQFGPEHLVAWWWLLDERMFRSLVANQLQTMRSPLVDAASDIRIRDGSFSTQMVDWPATLSTS